MRQLKTFGDSRTLSYCTFCGAVPETKDHCPSKIFLDEPYPENLPVVQSCLKCNNDFSIDEEYVACLISCVIDGTTLPDKISRPKIRRILEQKPLLLKRICQQSKKLSDTTLVFEPEVLRLKTVVIKLARGHALHEVHELCIQEPNVVKVNPVTELSGEEWKDFASSKQLSALPEVGSRAMQRLRIQEDVFFLDWIHAQPNAYSYHVSQNHAVEVRILLQNYLACYIRWDY
jgi:hypothetical protein